MSCGVHNTTCHYIHRLSEKWHCPTSEEREATWEKFQSRQPQPGFLATRTVRNHFQAPNSKPSLTLWMAGEACNVQRPQSNAAASQQISPQLTQAVGMGNFTIFLSLPWLLLFGRPQQGICGSAAQSPRRPWKKSKRFSWNVSSGGVE